MITVRKAKNKFDYARCVQVRTFVFTIGQNIPADREVDVDEDSATHFLALDNNCAVGAGRWRRCKDQTAKIERLAVLKSGRGKGIGRKIMQLMLDDIRNTPGINEITLGSQDHAIPFYESLGFVVYSEGYLDGGTIPHHDMRIIIKGNG